jgi:hypothetical protein
MQNRSYIRQVILLITLTLITLNIHGQKTREEIADKYKWNLTDIYKSDDDWKKAKDALAARAGELEKFKGILTRSAADLKGWLLLTTEIGKEASHLSSYASLNSDLDTRNQKYNGMQHSSEPIHQVWIKIFTLTFSLIIPTYTQTSVPLHMNWDIRCKAICRTIPSPPLSPTIPSLLQRSRLHSMRYSCSTI